MLQDIIIEEEGQCILYCINYCYSIVYGNFKLMLDKFSNPLTGSNGEEMKKNLIL
jgi:hypothetical protein